MGGHHKKKKVPKTPPPPKKAEAVESEVDFETLIKEEYLKLHRMYRLMENTSHAIVGASGKLSKQGHILVQLREQKESLTTDLNNATCKTYQQRDKNSIKTILKLLETYEAYRLENIRCITEMAEMEENVDNITKRLVIQKLKVQSIFGQAFTPAQVDRRIQVLENRLYRATTQFDSLVAKNCYLKDEIDMMLKLRGQFFRRIVHIKKLSARIKSKMGGVVYEASQAYEQRDDWVNKTSSLRDRNDKDSKQHVLEIKEFQRVLHDDSKNHDFMAQKNVLRDLLESTYDRTKRKNQIKVDDLNDLLHAYRKSFKDILKMSIYRDVESLVIHYLEEEQKNYSVFKYITDLSNEVNWLKQSIDETKAEIEVLNKENIKRELENDEILEKLENDLMDEKSNFMGVSSEWKYTDLNMEAFGKMLDQAFLLAGCSSDSVANLLGNSAGMRPNNVCLCMSILERKINELIDTKHKLEVRKLVEIEHQPLPKRTQYWQPGVKPLPCGGPFKPKLVITFRVDTEQEDEDNAEAHREGGSHPMYYDQIKGFVLEQIKEKKLSLLGDEPSIANVQLSMMDLSQSISRFSISRSDMDPAGHVQSKKSLHPVAVTEKAPNVSSPSPSAKLAPPPSPSKTTNPPQDTSTKAERVTQPQPASENASSDPQPTPSTPNDTQPAPIPPGDPEPAPVIPRSGPEPAPAIPPSDPEPSPAIPPSNPEPAPAIPPSDPEPTTENGTTDPQTTTTTDNPDTNQPPENSDVNADHDPTI